ncbi:hypothetical protein [Flavobacterium sp.]|uniref:hypothetical protein n=1 Tax=Flavobacterium sp. TaxID=239 RepID=UPI002FDA1383
MTKRTLAILSIVLFFSSCGLTIRMLSGFKDPVVQSKNDINQYVKENAGDFDTYFLNVQTPKDSTEIFERFLFGFNSDLYLFHTESGKKYCFQGTEECSGVLMQEAFKNVETNFSVCQSNNQIHLDNFLKLLQDKNGKSVSRSNLPNSEYYLFETWNTYMQNKKEFKENLKWLTALEQTNKKIKIIYINTDLLDDWGLEKGKKLPIKFKRNGKRSVELVFGKLPIKK